MRYHLTAAAFNCLVSIFSRAPTVKSGIVGVKPAFETGGRPRSRVEHQRADKRRRVISVASKNVRSIRQVLRQRHAEIVHLMKLRIRARKNGGV